MMLSRKLLLFFCLHYFGLFFFQVQRAHLQDLHIIISVIFTIFYFHLFHLFLQFLFQTKLWLFLWLLFLHCWNFLLLYWVGSFDLLFLWQFDDWSFCFNFRSYFRFGFWKTTFLGFEETLWFFHRFELLMFRFIVMIDGWSAHCKKRTNWY